MVSPQWSDVILSSSAMPEPNPAEIRKIIKTHDRCHLQLWVIQTLFAATATRLCPAVGSLGRAKSPQHLYEPNLAPGPRLIQWRFSIVMSQVKLQLYSTSENRCLFAQGWDLQLLHEATFRTLQNDQKSRHY